ncbi:MAG TPA: hypothetical protein DIT13_13775, partial [Verrucomicrobiales bacterium]|nr:hypothetical protein [Verrucomicrobiales bacterium]
MRLIHLVSLLLLLAFPSPALLAQAAPKGKGKGGVKRKGDKSDPGNWPDSSKGSAAPHAPQEEPPAATAAR